MENMDKGLTGHPDSLYQNVCFLIVWSKIWSTDILPTYVFSKKMKKKTYQIDFPRVWRLVWFWKNLRTFFYPYFLQVKSETSYTGLLASWGKLSLYSEISLQNNCEGKKF